MRMGLKLLTTVALAAAISLPANAQSGIELLDPEVMEAALAEGQVNIYAVYPQSLLESLAAAFNEEVPGIEVTILRAASGPIANRFMSEADVGIHEADILNSASQIIYTERPELWHELTVDLVPTLADWPEEEVVGTYLNATLANFLIAYNTDLLTEDEAPKTWEDVLDPKYTGRGMLVDPRASNIYLNWLNLMYDSYGPEYIERLRDQNFALVEGGTQGIQQVASGAHLIAFPPSSVHFDALSRQGAPIAAVYPNEHSDVPAIGPQNSWGMPATSPHPNAARVFMTWLLTPEAQQVNCEGVGASVLLTDYEPCPPAVSGFLSADQIVPPERTAELLRLLGVQ